MNWVVAPLAFCSTAHRELWTVDGVFCKSASLSVRSLRQSVIAAALLRHASAKLELASGL